MSIGKTMEEMEKNDWTIKSWKNVNYLLLLLFTMFIL